ncbi:hypothetical protein LTR60_006907, partial [Cryomyces antarcticus]
LESKICRHSRKHVLVHADTRQAPVSESVWRRRLCQASNTRGTRSTATRSKQARGGGRLVCAESMGSPARLRRAKSCCLGFVCCMLRHHARSSAQAAEVRYT